MHFNDQYIVVFFEYPFKMLELVHFSIKLISKTFTIVFNVSKVHKIRYVKV